MSDTDPTEFTSWSFVASATLVVALVLAAVVIGVSHAFAHHAPAREASAFSAPVKAVASAGNPHDCDLPAGSQSIPQVAPAASWGTVGQMQVPQRASATGPEHEVDGVGECFAHNPTGALYAAMNFVAANTAMSEGKALSLLAVASWSTRALIAQEQGSDTELQNSDGDPGTVSFAGFTVSDYTPAAEDLTLAVQGPDGSYAAVQVTEVWEHNDWWTHVPAGGQLVTEPLSTLGGFIPWSAE